MKITKHEIESIAKVLREHYGNSLPPINEEHVAEKALIAAKTPPECTCDGAGTYTMYEGNWGGHSVSCPRREYDNDQSAGFLTPDQLLERAGNLVNSVKTGKIDAGAVASEVGKLLRVYGDMKRR